MQKLKILTLNTSFIFVYLHHFENLGSWIVYQKGKMKQINSLDVFYS